MEKEILFALDIGTRSVVGIVGERVNKKINIIAIDRQEHLTRAMLDGQIHDVLQVAQTIGEIKNRLVEKTGLKLKKASVAAAGRSLITITSSAELDTSSTLTLDAQTEKALELTAVQNAQRQLAADSRASDPTGYYCVGYSVIEFKLDGARLTSLVGQRGKIAQVSIIATFLPKPVIDSMQSALTEAELQMGTITLEPIAAINVLIPPTMRHLNLALVDIGAGTSDVAITSNGSVIGFGMVPSAGDEITEAISQKYLLDFNVAEQIKRQINDNPKKIEFTDVLGLTTQTSVKEVTEALTPAVQELANLIAEEILTLNNKQNPQAILLIGGGALTPLLPQLIAQAINMPPEKVAVRQPAPTLQLPQIPKELQIPDAITPLGILCLTNSDHLNFITIKMNKQIHRLFNLGALKLSDALISSNIDIDSIKGKPGLGLAIEVNGQTKFIPGTHGTPGVLEINGSPATLDDKLKDSDKIKVTKGVPGKSPKVSVLDVADCSPLGHFYLNGKKHPLNMTILVNDQQATSSTKLADRDKVEVHPPHNIGQALNQIGYQIPDAEFEYIINKNPVTHKGAIVITLNGQIADLGSPISAGDVITIEKGNPPTLEQLLALDTITTEKTTALFNGKPVQIGRTFKEFFVNNKPVKMTYIPSEDDDITFKVSKKTPMVSDVLLAGQLDPQKLVKDKQIIEIYLNGEKTEFTAPVKGGDEITTQIKLV